jgi:hypothetical protein
MQVMTVADLTMSQGRWARGLVATSQLHQIAGLLSMLQISLLCCARSHTVRDPSRTAVKGLLLALKPMDTLPALCLEGTGWARFKATLLRWCTSGFASSVYDVQASIF